MSKLEHLISLLGGRIVLENDTSASSACGLSATGHVQHAELLTASTPDSPTSASEAAGPSPPLPPVERYVVRGMLGSGASGTVLMVRSNMDGARIFALKVVSVHHPPLSEGERAREENIIDEIKCWSRCDSQFIVRLHSTFHLDTMQPPGVSSTAVHPEQLQKAAAGAASEATPHPREGASADDTAEGDAGTASLRPMRSYALLMELIECLDLRKELKKRKALNKPLRTEEAAALFAQMLIALQHLHGRGIVHRDVKTGNILLKQNGIVKLGDFGYAKELVDGCGPASYVGTPYYVAPEVWRREAYDTRADMWSLGVVFYELLTLQRPFGGATIEDVRRSALRGEYEPPGTHDDLVAHMLCVDPARRPTAAQLLLTPELQRILRGLRVAIDRSAGVSDAEKAGMVAEIAEWIRPEAIPLAPVRRNTVPSSAMSAAGGAASSSNGSVSTAPATMTSIVDGNVLYQGTLLKRCSDGAFRNRFLRIARDAGSGDVELMLSFDEPSCESKDRRVTTRAALFTSIIALPQDSDEGPACHGDIHFYPFRVHSREFQPMVFAAKSELERQRWVDELLAVMPPQSSNKGTLAAN